MRRLQFIFVLTIVFNEVLFPQTPTTFVISADWLNNPNNQATIPSAADWVRIKELGLNWGSIILDTSAPLSVAQTALTDAANNGVTLILDRFRLAPAVQGVRWQYHPEYSAHYPSMGRVGVAGNELTAKKFPDDEQDQNNAWGVLVGRDAVGYMAINLVPDTDQTLGTEYIVKLRMRIDNSVPSPFQHTPVVTVIVRRETDGFQRDSTIYLDQFTDYSYKEIRALHFKKTLIGDLAAVNQADYLQSIQPIHLMDTLGFAGVHDYPATLLSLPGIDYRVHWEGAVSCWLDYVIVEDSVSNCTFTGQFNAAINAEVDLFKSHAALGRYKTCDEPIGPQYLGIGNVEQVIKTNVELAGVPSKRGFHYCTGKDPYFRIDSNYVRRDLAWTQNIQADGDLYATHENTPLPGAPGYTLAFQNLMQTNLADQFRWYITYANQYGVPFWFTPQAHSWYFGAGSTNNLRQPAPIELKLMVNLGLAYGAKGIDYFLYRSYYGLGVIDSGLTDLNGLPIRQIYSGTRAAGDKWDTVKAINHQLALLGPTLIGLTWQKAFSIHLQPSLGGEIITNVSTSDAAGSRYVELSMFVDSAASKYFMLVNRRTDTSETRNITTSFSLPSGYYKITELISGKTWTIANTGSFTDIFAPGSGKLYKIGTATYLEYLLALATQNQSLAASATAGNSQRKLYRESSGKLHEVFESGGEVFYRNTSDGVTWQNTLRLSDGTGLNSAPAISGRYTYYAPFLYVMWQKTQGSNWDIVYNYSTNAGAMGSWQGSPIALASSVSCTSPGPLPTVMCSQQGFTIEQLAVWRQSTQLSYGRTTNAYPSSASGWSTGSVPQTISSSQYPSLGVGYQQKFILAWDEGGQIFTQWTSFGSGWSGSKQNISSGAYMVSNKKNPSIAFSSNGDQHVVWEGIYGGHSSIVTNRNQLNVWYVITNGNNECQGGSVSGNDNGNANVVWWDNSNTSRYTQLVGGVPQSSYTLGNALKYPSLSVGNPQGGIARCLVTSTAGSPYVVQLTGQSFQKTVPLPMIATTHIVSFTDSTGNGVFSIQLSGPVLRSGVGQRSTIQMVQPPDNSASVAAEPFSYLSTLPFLPSGDSDTLSFEVALENSAESDQLILKTQTMCELVSARNGEILFTQTLSSGSAWEGSKMVSIPYGILPARSKTDSVYIRVNVLGFPYGNDNLSPSFVGVFDLSQLLKDVGKAEGNQSISAEHGENEIFNCYPNPFNPSTQISYSLSEAGKVSLVIYDVLGREITSLANGYQQAGRYAVTWNALQTSGVSVSSGMYFARLRVTDDLGMVKFTKTSRLLLMK